MSKPLPHVRVPHQWTKANASKLSMKAFKLYFVLLSYADWKTGVCVVKQNTLAKTAGMTRQSVNASLAELTRPDIKLVEYERSKIRNTQGEAQTYHVHNPMHTHSILPM